MMIFSWKHETSHLSQSMILEERSNPMLVNISIIAISMLITGFVLWASVTEISEVARTPGEIVPKSNKKEVQNMDGGTVLNLRVKNGDIVKKNDIILVLNDDGMKEDLAKAKIRDVNLSLQEEKIRAFLENRNPDFTSFNLSSSGELLDQERFVNDQKYMMNSERSIVNDQISQKNKTIMMLQEEKNALQQNQNIAQDLYNKRQALNKSGYISNVKYMEALQNLNAIKSQIESINGRVAVINSEIAESNSRIVSLGQSRKQALGEQLDAVMAEKEENATTIYKLERRLKDLTIRANEEGIVKGLSVKMPGDVIRPGQLIAEIVPMTGGLMAHIKISPQYIGHVANGQNVNVKFSSYDFARYGYVQGKLQNISATTFETDKGERYYEADVNIETDHVGSNIKNRILPGMTVMAEIITGEKTVADYLLKPIQTNLHSALMER